MAVLKSFEKKIARTLKMSAHRGNGSLIFQLLVSFIGSIWETATYRAKVRSISKNRGGKRVHVYF